MATDKSGVIDQTPAYTTDIDWNKQPGEASGGTTLPTIKLQDDTVGYFLGEDLITPAPGVQQSALNYADAFDPNGSIYSVNTGNATVHQIEDLKSLMSPAPPVVQNDSTFMIPTALLGLLLLL